MTVRVPLPGELEPIERASRDELRSLQLQRMQWSLKHAYDNVPHYRRAFDAKGVRPEDLRELADLARFPFTVKSDLRDNYPFGLFAVPKERIARLHASSGTTGKPTVVGYTLADIDTWANLVARFDPRGRRASRRHGPHRLRLRPLHRRPRRALRRRARRLHGDPDVGRADGKAGPAHHRPEAQDHHGHALVHAGADRGADAPGHRTRARPASRSASSAPSRGPRRCARRSSWAPASTRSTSTVPLGSDGPGRGERVRREQGRPGGLGRPLLSRDHRPSDRRSADRRRGGRTRLPRL